MADMISRALLGLVAWLHLGFFVLESLMWQRPTGLKVFKMTPAEAEATATLAFNQGVYNAFIATGLFWAAVSRRRDVAILFTLFVIIAGIVGALTAKPSILFVQALPGVICLTAIMLFWRPAKPSP